jgi:RNA polymerase sigma-70 factor (ECF subfamily)
MSDAPASPPMPSTAHDAPPSAPARLGGDAIAPAYLSLRAALTRFIAARVRAEHVDDLVQDTLLRMHERAADLRDQERLAGWAFRIAQSVVADHHRRARPTVPLDGDVDAGEDGAGIDRVVGAAAEVDAGNVNEIVAGWLRPMLALLPEEYAQALELVDVQGKSQRELAELAGLSLSGAKSRVQRGRKMLEEVVRTCCDLELDARGNVVGYERRNCSCG